MKHKLLGRCAFAILGFEDRESSQIRFYYKGSKGPNIAQGFQSCVNLNKG